MAEASLPTPGAGLLKRLTEYFSVATVVSFALSILANQLVFDRWGLNFLQLATIADVVMSGLSLLMYTLPLAVVLLAAWWAGGANGLWRWLLIVPYLVGLVFAVAGVWGLTGDRNSVGAGAAMALGGLVLGGLTIQPAMRLGAVRRVPGLALLGGVGALLLFSVVQFVTYTVSTYAVGGYAQTTPLRLTSPLLPACDGRVLWTGERSLVLDCDPQPDRQDIHVAVSPENWVFRAEAGAPVHSTSSDQTS